ncbi:uncharacterized protein LOC124155548 isoform X3 [Ischnura elegans]|uniref:uncharacterized protein LOC124155548 isoform X3 n=1 Tax=Ischnura elegans TaxID=197161 RepID=UPI001ED8BAF8|nr:uncharacterized protein LOC124155548 isoform X3 [Ischnura elegans]
MDCFTRCVSGVCGSTTEAQPSFDLLTTLPPELTCTILRMLDPASLLSCAHVNKQWLAFVRSDPLLRSRVHRHIRRQRKAVSRAGERLVSNCLVLTGGAVNVYVYQYDVGSAYGWSDRGVPEHMWDIASVPPLMPVPHCSPRRRLNPASTFHTLKDAMKRRFLGAPQSPPAETVRRSTANASPGRRRPARGRTLYVTSL